MRPETGPMKFGDDWTGVFFRGDNALWFAALLELFLSGYGNSDNLDIISRCTIEGFISDLRSCAEPFCANPQRAILVTDEPTKDQE